MGAPELRRAVFGGHPRHLGQVRIEGAVPRVGQLTLAVAPDPDRPLPQPGQPFQGLRGHRAGGHVAVEHDRVRPGGLGLREHGVERGQVSVDVGKDGDAHAGSSRWPGSFR